MNGLRVNATTVSLLVIAMSPRPIRRWCFTMLGLFMCMLFSLEPSKSLEPSWFPAEATPVTWAWLVVMALVFALYPEAGRRSRALMRGEEPPPQSPPPPVNIGPIVSAPRPVRPKALPAGPPKVVIGESLPTIWRPTYVGNGPVHRLEIGDSGTVIRDRRPIDEEDL